MAYDFVAASSQRISVPVSGVSATPLTIAAFINTDLPDGVIVSVNSAGVSRNQITVTNVPTIYATSVDTGGGVSFSTSVPYSHGTWVHACGVFAAANSRTAYLNGAATSAETTPRTVGAITDIYIGSRWNGSSHGFYLDGRIAEAAVWSVALSQAEISALAKGVSPALIRPQSLVFYAPLIRELVDERGGLTLTPTGSPTVADHPRVYR